MIDQIPARLLEAQPVAEDKPFLISDLAAEFERTRLADAADSTVVLYDKGRRNLIDCFGDVDITTLSMRDGREFWRWLIKDEKLATNTAKQRLRFARTFWELAIEDGLVEFNPFKAKGLSVTQTAAEKEYISWDRINKVIDKCPSPEWKLLFTMTRSIPMRIPSEIRELTWADVDRERNTILIHSPKTRAIGKSARLVPVFSNLEPLLADAYDRAATGEEYVFPELRRITNLGKLGGDIVEKAKVKRWTNFWNSIRASAETDLMDEYGLRRACMWSGNSANTAMKNYALVRKTDYDDSGMASKIKSDAKSDAIADGIKRKVAESQTKSPEKLSFPEAWMGDTGLEPVTSTL